MTRRQQCSDHRHRRRRLY